MIQSIELTNFKAIKQKYFPLGKLNLLLGLNGQGKSSFIQSLLLLRQSDKLPNGELKLNSGENGLVNIGTSQDALYQYSPNNEFSIGLQFKEQAPYCMNFIHQMDADILKQKSTDSIDRKLLEHNSEEALFNSKFQYLNAQRIEPKATNIASYSNVMEANSIGKHGQYTAHYIELRGNEPIQFDNLLHPKSKTVDRFTKKETVDRRLLNQINLWLGEISPGVNVITSKISTDIILLEYEFEQPNLGSTNKFKPENVGFGISYSLHVLTALLSAQPGGLVIIENPESHIHPQGQSTLGRLITLLALNDVQIVIETHSDHILNGIRVGIKEHPALKDETMLFFFKKIVDKHEQFASVINIKIDKNGTLSNYPQHLLDEWSNQLSKLV
ncbi:MAG: DUF3696 domain-containing protein [Aureispira sp.]